MENKHFSINLLSTYTISSLMAKTQAQQFVQQTCSIADVTNPTNLECNYLYINFQYCCAGHSEATRGIWEEVIRLYDQKMMMLSLL